MSPAMEPMSFDELSELYRVEMKSNAITHVRRDLFRAMTDLLTSLRLDYDRQMALDPDSVMCEGADQRRKKAKRLVKDVVHIRTQKICLMAIRGAMGGRNTLDVLTPEEKYYYDRVLELSRIHMAETDRLRGKRNAVATRIDEVPTESELELVSSPELPSPEEVFFDNSSEDFQDDQMLNESDGFGDPFDEPVTEPETTQEQPLRSASVSEPESTSELVTAEAEPAGDPDELKPILIRILEDLPEFVGPDRDYKLSREDLVTLPKVLAEVLINSEKATAVRPTL